MHPGSDLRTQLAIQCGRRALTAYITGGMPLPLLKQHELHRSRLPARSCCTARTVDFHGG